MITSASKRIWYSLCHVAVLALVMPSMAHAQPMSDITEIVVTAQKQEQATNTVSMSITTATGDLLQARGINGVADLTRLVPGLTIQYSAFNSTSFTLRGVGFFNSDLATPAAVTVYVDEAPLPYPAMTKLAAFDLARVEVLKGPQGTLFGENATGGAVNYIAARPPTSFAAGVDASYGNFNRWQIGGFVGGPLNDRLSFRVALQGRHGDRWQRSITRPGDRLGRVEELQARATLDWHPSPSVDSRLTLTVTHDGSDSEAAQFISPHITIPALSPGLAAFPIVTRPRAADWAPLVQGSNKSFPYASNTNFYQFSWRNDLRLNSGVTLTSLTSAARFRMNYGQDPDGTPFHNTEIVDRGGKVSSYFEELRATALIGGLLWLIGGNVEHETTSDNPVDFTTDNSVSHILQAVDPLAIADSTMFTSHLRSSTFAAFGRLQYSVSDRLSVEGAVRYNEDERTFDNCAIATTDPFARFWNIFRGGAQPPTRIGDCYVIDTANGQQPVGNVHSRLNQDSVSWRIGVDWTQRPGFLLYANISKGYKAGAVPVLGAATVSQFTPVRQESLLAYEIGTKASMFDRHLQINAAGFYYVYRGKQLRGAELDPSFGPLEALVSIPRSHVVGAEAQLMARPIEGLTLDTSATYVHTNIDRFTGFDGLANFADQSGTPFPFSPTWQSITNLDYEFPVPGELRAFVGGSLTFNSKTYAGIGALKIMQIDAYALLDLRVGVKSGNGRYRLWIWGKNVTDKYYWTNVFAGGDAISRFVGQPATYGVSASTRL
ncbi:TonB-dependent receptor [Rhizorhabdus argentea]|uniref:TonB-dependent receptor n=1 Tax=Rhizorhabdus argentea TaxID=1387174 RepID=UPI0030EEF18D